MSKASNDIDVESFDVHGNAHEEWAEAGYAFGRGKRGSDDVDGASLLLIEKAGERGELSTLWDLVVETWPLLEHEVPAEARKSFGFGLVRAVEDGQF